MIFTIVGSMFAVVIISTALSVWKIFPKKKDLWRVIPREKRFGLVLGFICLVWSAYHTFPIFETTAPKVRFMVLAALVVTITILSFNLMDFLFARALGGFLLLLVNWLLHQAFVHHAVFRPLFSTLCYIVGISGIIMIAAPYHFRDLLEKISHNQQWRIITSAILGAIGCVVLFIAIYPYVS